MRLEWLEDLLAVIECGSIQAAAERRMRSQPAFSRRIQAIEAYLGVELVERSKKPAQLKPAVLDRTGTMQELAFGLQTLIHDLRRDGADRQTRVVVACQHAITTALMPGFVKRIAPRDDLSLRVRSENHDVCFAMLMTRRADICLVYGSPLSPLPGRDVLEERVIAAEQLVPVFETAGLPRLAEDLARGMVPIVAYPADVFFGHIVLRDVYPRLGSAVHLHKLAETALTPAALQFALAGVGVAWLPRALAERDLAAGRLTDLCGTLPSSPLSLIALRWRDEERPAAADAVWDAIAALGPSG